MLPETPHGYADLFEEITTQIQSARIQTASLLSTQVVRLYWQIGRLIADRIRQYGWGIRVVDRLADDLRTALPGTRGFSRRSLHYMRALATSFPDEEFFTQPVSQVPWGHIVALIDGISDNGLRNWYAAEALRQGWGQNMLRHNIRTAAHLRYGQALTNFGVTLSSDQSDLARDLLKDPYVLDYLELDPSYRERDLQRALVQRIMRFMVELGRGFAFLGEQYRLAVAGEEFFVDLLFYHIRLKRLFVVELKVDDFKPEYAGKMAFYLSAVDDLVRPPGDPSSIGLILCAGRNETIVEYALRTTTAPIAVSTYRVRDAMPTSLQQELPSPSELKAIVEEEKQRLVTAKSRSAAESRSSETGPVE